MSRREAGSADWYCKHCRDDRNKDAPFKNFASRMQCKKCGLEKGKCFKSKAEPASPSTRAPKALAERQLGQQRQAGKEAQRMAKLQRENAQLQQQLASLQRPDKSAEADDDDDAVPRFKFTVEQLLGQRALLLQQGASCADDEIVRLDRQLKIQRDAKLSSLPPAARVAKADKQIAGAEKRVAVAVEKRAVTEEEIMSLQAKFADQGLEIDKARTDLEDAQRQRDLLYKELRPDAEVAPVTSSVFEAMGKVANALAPEDFQAWGLQGPEQLAQVLAGFQRACEAATAKAQEEKAAAAAAAASAAAAQAEEAAKRATQQPPGDTAGSVESKSRWADSEDCADIEMEVDETQINQVLPVSMDDTTRKQLMAVLAKSVKPKRAGGVKSWLKEKAGGKPAVSTPKQA